MGRRDDRYPDPSGDSTSDLRLRAEERLAERKPVVSTGGGEPALRHELEVHQVELEMQNEELRDATKRLEEAADRLTDLYDFAPLGFVSLDERGNILGINHAGAQLLGQERTRLTGGRFGFFVSDSDRATFNDFIANAFGGGTDRRPRCELTLSLDERGSVPVRLVATIIPRPRPEALIALEDLSEQARAAKEVSQLNSELVERDRRKDEFLGMLSHELRNPLAPIRNASYVLRHSAPGSEQAVHAQQVIERQTQHLTRLVDDLLDVTRIARGKIELRRTRVDLREVVGRAADDFRWTLQDRGVKLEVSLPENPLWTDADETRVAQIIGNLLHNGAKFTRRGDTVTLSMAVTEGMAEIRVRDTGAGIDPALLPHVFDAFVQGERTLARAQGGLGLGLALVKGITELHGGSVHAASAGQAKGSEFMVRLPLATAGNTQEADPHRLEARGGTARHVLVVDDNRDAAESLAEIVRILGHHVEIAYDGPSAIEKARAHAPDIVLCDIGLPGMTGYEVASRLREAGTAAQLFAVSGYAQPEDLAKAVAAGFDGHLAKPCDPVEVERLLT